MGLLTAKWAGITGRNTEDLQGLFDCEQETVTMCQEKGTLSSAHAEQEDSLFLPHRQGKHTGHPTVVFPKVEGKL